MDIIEENEQQCFYTFIIVEELMAPFQKVNPMKSAENPERFAKQLQKYLEKLFFFSRKKIHIKIPTKLQ